MLSFWGTVYSPRSEKKQKNPRTDLFSPSADLYLWIFFIASNFRLPSKKNNKNVKPTYIILLGMSFAESFLLFLFFAHPEPPETEQKKYKTDVYSRTHADQEKNTYRTTHLLSVYGSRKPCKYRGIRFNPGGGDSFLRSFRILSSRCTRKFPIISRIQPGILSRLPKKRRKDIFTFLLIFSWKSFGLNASCHLVWMRCLILLKNFHIAACYLVARARLSSALFSPSS